MDCSWLQRADNGLSERASSLRLGMTHSWLEPKPLFPAICPSLPLHSVQRKVNEIISPQTASPSPHGDNGSRRDSQEREMYDCYKGWLLIFTTGQRTVNRVIEVKKDKQTVYTCVTAKKECVREMRKDIKKGAEEELFLRRGWSNGRQGDTDRPVKKVFAQHFTCQWHDWIPQRTAAES